MAMHLGKEECILDCSKVLNSYYDKTLQECKCNTGFVVSKIADEGCIEEVKCLEKHMYTDDSGNC